MHTLAEKSVALAGNPRIAAILRHVCDLTGMGFAAVARVTDDRWIACHVLDQIEFGLDAGEELDLKTTICNDIRLTGQAIVFDCASADGYWRSHPTPILYGFESYLAVPITLSDGAFFGTLCALDPAARRVDMPELVATIRTLADEIAAILDSPDPDPDPDPAPMVPGHARAGIASPR